jgi:hypothetical protein
MAQGEGPEFKFQYCKKRKEKERKKKHTNFEKEEVISSLFMGNNTVYIEIL